MTPMTMMERIAHAKRISEAQKERAARRKAFQAEGKRLADTRKALQRIGSESTSGDSLGFLIMVAMRDGEATNHG
jgi:hypothetical protein